MVPKYFRAFCNITVTNYCAKFPYSYTHNTKLFSEELPMCKWEGNLAWCVGSNWRTQRQRVLSLLLLNLKVDTVIIFDDDSNRRATWRKRNDKRWFYLSQLLKRKRRNKRAIGSLFCRQMVKNRDSRILDINLEMLGTLYTFYIALSKSESSSTANF